MRGGRYFSAKHKVQGCAFTRGGTNERNWAKLLGGQHPVLGPDQLERMTNQIRYMLDKLIVHAFGLWSILPFSFQDRKTEVLTVRIEIRTESLACSFH